MKCNVSNVVIGIFMLVLTGCGGGGGPAASSVSSETALITSVGWLYDNIAPDYSNNGPTCNLDIKVYYNESIAVVDIDSFSVTAPNGWQWTIPASNGQQGTSSSGKPYLAGNIYYGDNPHMMPLAGTWVFQLKLKNGQISSVQRAFHEPGSATDATHQDVYTGEDWTPSPVTPQYIAALGRFPEQGYTLQYSAANGGLLTTTGLAAARTSFLAAQPHAYNMVCWLYDVNKSYLGYTITEFSPQNHSRTSLITANGELSIVPASTVSSNGQLDLSTVKYLRFVYLDGAQYEPSSYSNADYRSISSLVAVVAGSTPVNNFHPTPSPAPPLSQAVAYQIDYAHSGYASLGSAVTFPGSPTWSATLNGAVSYPLIAGGKVFVTTRNSSSYGTSLYALDEQTGSVAWGPIAISGTDFWSGHAYDHGKLFVVNCDGLLLSFDAATGQPGWSIKLPGQYLFSAPPTAINGIVYVGGAGSGGTIYAVDESNGTVLWTSAVENGDMSSPTISSDGVFVSYPCQVYKFDPLTGSLLWRYSGGCEGGGGKTSVYANGQLYVRDSSDLVFNAGTGSMVGSFASNAAPAFSAQSGFFLSSGTLTGIDLGTQRVLWRFTGDGSLVSAPIVINQSVIVGSGSGNVYAVNAATGSLIWSGKAAANISGPDEQNVSQPLTGLGAGEGYLVVPAGNTLTAWYLVGP